MFFLMAAACVARPSISSENAGAEAAQSRWESVRSAVERQQSHPDARAMQAGVPPDLDPALLNPLGPEESERAAMPSDAVLALFRSQAAAAAAPREAPPPVGVEAETASLRAYAAGRLRLREGDLPGATQSLQEAVRLNPAAREAWRELGEAHMRLASRIQAENAFRRAFELSPDDPVVVERLAGFALDRGEAEQAARLLATIWPEGNGSEDAVRPVLREFDPALPHLVAWRLGRALLELGYLSAAVDMLERAIDLPAQFGYSTARANDLGAIYRLRGDTWRDIGDARMRLGWYERALSAYDRAAGRGEGASAGTEDPGAVSTNPASITPRRVLAAMKLGQPARAALIVGEELTAVSGRADDRLLGLIAYVASWSASPRHMESVVEAVAAGLSEDQFKLVRGQMARARAAALPDAGAVDVLREYIAVYPSDAAAIGDLYSRLHRISSDAQSADAGAFRVIEETLSLTSAAPLHVSSYVNALMRVRGPATECLRAVQSLPVRQRTSPAGRLVEAALLLACGRVGDSADGPGAESVLRELEAGLPSEPVEAANQIRAAAVIQRSTALVRLGRKDEASALLDAMHVEGDAALRYAKGLALAEQERFAESLGTLEPLLADASVGGAGGFDPGTQANLLVLAARIHLKLGNPSEAEQRLLAALAIDPRRDDAYASLISLYARNGPLANDDKLVKLIRRMRELHPSGRTLRWIRARESAAHGQTGIAERDLMDLAEENPRDEEAVEALTGLWLQSGSADRAEEWLAPRIDRFPGEGVYPRCLARALVARRKADKAVLVLEQWLEKVPGDVTALSELEDVLRSEFPGLEEYEQRADKVALRRLSLLAETAEALSERAEIEARTGELRAAAATVRTLLERFPHPSEEVTERLDRLLAQLMSEGAAGRTDVADAIGLAREMVGVCPGLSDLSMAAYLVLCARAGDSVVPMKALCDAADRVAQASDTLGDSAYVVVIETLRTARGVQLRAGRPSEKEVEEARRNQMIMAAAVARHAIEQARARGAVKPPAPLLSVWLIVALDFPDHEARKEETRRVVGMIKEGGLIEDVVAYLSPRPDDGPEGEEAHRKIKADVATELAAGLSRAEMDDAAARFYRVALRYHPRHPDANNNLGYYLLRDDATVEEGSRLIQTAFEEAPQEAHIVDSLGWARYRMGVIFDEPGTRGRAERRGAVSLLREALSLAAREQRPGVLDPTPVMEDHLGDALWAAGQRDEAQRRWRAAAESAERGLQLLEQLQRLDVESLRAELREVVESSTAKLRAVESGMAPPVARMLRPVNGTPVPDAGEVGESGTSEEASPPMGVSPGQHEDH